MRVCETMRRAVLTEHGGSTRTRYVIRLWMDGTDSAYADAALALAADLASKQPSTEDAAEVIANSIEGLAAVEVLDAEGNGNLVYPNWS